MIMQIEVFFLFSIYINGLTTVTLVCFSKNIFNLVYVNTKCNNLNIYISRYLFPTEKVSLTNVKKKKIPKTA